MKKALGINDLLNIKFDEYPFEGKWFDHLGAPERNFRMLIYGPEKNGKTDYTLKLAKYISTWGKVYINSHEEGRSKTLQTAFIRNNMQEVAGKVMILHKEDLATLRARFSKRGGRPRFLIIDSLDYMELTDQKYRDLIDEYPNMSIIMVCWSDKNDNPLLHSARMIAKRVDIKVKVKLWVAYPTSRFSDAVTGNKPMPTRDDNYTPKPSNGDQLKLI